MLIQLKLFTSLLFCLPLLVFSQKHPENLLKRDSVHITLHIKKAPHTSLTVSQPLHGCYLIGNWTNFKTDKTGKVSAALPLDSAGIYHIWLSYLPPIGRQKGVQVFVKPGDHVEISLEKGREFETLSFKGDNIIENQLLNAFDRYIVDYWGKSEYLQSLMRNKNGETFLDTIKTLEQKDLQFLNQYAKNHKLNQQLKDVVREDMRYYYALLYFIGCQVNKLNMEKLKDTSGTYKWTKGLENVFLETELNNPHALGSLWYSEYKNRVWYPYYKWSERNIRSTKETIQDIISELFTGRVKEHQLAHRIVNASAKNKFSKSTQEAFFFFQTNFPKSPFLPMLEKEFKDVLAFKKQERGKISVFENATVGGLEDLINRYPNKVLYIDVWASWCGPCKMEFKVKEPDLDSFFLENDIQRIYISIDALNKKEMCTEIIEFYSLKGDHYLANSALTQSLQKKLNNGKSLSIPRYFIVDSNGNLVVKSAFRPSDADLLRAQLEPYVE